MFHFRAVNAPPSGQVLKPCNERGGVARVAKATWENIKLEKPDLPVQPAYSTYRRANRASVGEAIEKEEEEEEEGGNKRRERKEKGAGQKMNRRDTETHILSRASEGY
jgi:hypothetical protein